MEDKATPRPWRIEPQNNGDFSVISMAPPGDHRSLIADCPSLMDDDTSDPFAAANASLIVRAVNSYEAHRALVEVVQDYCLDEANELGPRSERLRAALAAVEAAENA